MALMLTTSVATSWADDDIKNDEFNPITTGVTSLSITPDARGASMGDQGAATDPDVNSQFWNPSKYAFAYSKAGVSISYTPWLRKLVNDIFLANLSGYWKIGSGDNQAVSASMRYFSLGEINSTDDGGNAMASINPFEVSVDVGYSRKLSEKFSMGVALRYIYSDLGYSSYSGTDQTTGETKKETFGTFYAIHKTHDGQMAPLARGIYMPLTDTPTIGNYNNPTQMASGIYYQEGVRYMAPELVQKVTFKMGF